MDPKFHKFSAPVFIIIVIEINKNKIIFLLSVKKNIKKYKLLSLYSHDHILVFIVHWK